MNEQRVKDLFEQLMVEGLGLDLTDPNLINTPARIARMYCKEFFRGTGEDFSRANCTLVPNTHHYDQIKLHDNIHFTSICAHHFLPFTGTAWLAYIPDKWLIGASKVDRMIAHYAARPQIQANLCHQILNRFEKLVAPKGAMLVMRAVHGCLVCRGVKQHNGRGMTSSAITGYFKRFPNTKNEVLDLIKISIMDKQ